MFKPAKWSILILLITAVCGTLYLYRHKELSGYSPELDRMIRRSKIDPGQWRQRAAAFIDVTRKIISETLSKLDGVLKPEKYLPTPAKKPEETIPRKTNRRKEPSATKHVERSSIFDLFKTPAPSMRSRSSAVYTWVDKRGTRHFSDTKPAGGRYPIETAQP